MGLNKEALNYFAAGMADIQMYRNPLAEEVIVIFNSVTRDHYQDSITTEEGRVKKMALVTKDLDMEYVQQLGDVLLEDNDHLPWVVSLTITDLIRIPKTDDQILIGGVRYNVSYVKPVNRAVDSIVNISVYPDRSEEDDLKVFKVTLLPDGYVDILYGGNPVEMSFSADAVSDKTKREKFSSVAWFPTKEGVLYLFDDNDNYTYYKYQLV